ncbi:MAG TPA: hypothetical protein VMS17_17740 [Gemmataceae bacterium]|nr:hypothetical protein [Gemmataceae bacterium]
MNEAAHDALAAAIAHQAADLTARVAELQQAAGSDVSTTDRARVLILLADLTDRADEALDRLHAFAGVGSDPDA